MQYIFWLISLIFTSLTHTGFKPAIENAIAVVNAIKNFLSDPTFDWLTHLTKTTADDKILEKIRQGLVNAVNKLTYLNDPTQPIPADTKLSDVVTHISTVLQKADDTNKTSAYKDIAHELGLVLTDNGLVGAQLDTMIQNAYMHLKNQTA